MKQLLIVLFMLITARTYGQYDVAGNYHDYFGSSLELKQDSTFRYTWHFDLQGSWTSGKWRMEKKIIYLHAISVYDTVRYQKGQVLGDSLVLSLDEISNSISTEEYALSTFSSGGQNRMACPSKLFHRSGKLFSIDTNGRVITRRFRGFWTTKKYPSYYIRKKQQTSA